MTTEEKQLLLKDLCARLPYGIMAYASEINKNGIITDVNIPYNMVNLTVDISDGKYELVPLFDIKPYLRPISSMTDEEMDKLFDILKIDKGGKDEDWIKINDILGIKFFFPTGKWVEQVALAYDYLYSIHLDFRGLIPMGLAIEAPEEIYES